ncbi:MAG TPA: hypothetical protein VE291_04165 [Terracidiphilus sp.]|nr:hypothetical protein [Terracidiphilus sp.]
MEFAIRILASSVVLAGLAAPFIASSDLTVHAVASPQSATGPMPMPQCNAGVVGGETGNKN